MIIHTKEVTYQNTRGVTVTVTLTANEWKKRRYHRIYINEVDKRGRQKAWGYIDVHTGVYHADFGNTASFWEEAVKDFVQEVQAR